MQPGLYKLVFSDLPSRWDSSSVQARVSGNAKVLGIDTMTRQVATPPANLVQLVEAVKEASKAYRHTSDELAGFIGTVVVEDPAGSILGSDLMGLYLDWTVAENTRSWSRRALYGAVIERVAGAYKEKRMDGIHIVGVRLA